MFRPEERLSQQGYIVINGIRFAWRTTHRGGNVLTVNNPLYGSTEWALEPRVAQEDLVRHLAIELLCQGPLRASELFPDTA